jgi:uncharacterized peroxidase-related enzyme
MAHINLGNDHPGILGPMNFRKETARPLNALAEALLRAPSPLPPGERELIAAYTSHLNDCDFCCRSHSAFCAVQIEGGAPLVEAVKRDLASAPISDKLKALLKIAAAVQRSGRDVTSEHIQAARDQGASDVEIHDAVLIAAAFCMFNRYVDGLGTFAPPEGPAYDGMAQMIVAQGYTSSV